MNKLTNLIIDFQRWNYRRKTAKAKRDDSEKMAKAIVKANNQSISTKKRLWVIKNAPSDYVICTKQQVRAFFRKLSYNGIMFTNYMQTNEYIIHITNKPIE